jgi:hypothetical protein
MKVVKIPRNFTGKKLLDTLLINENVVTFFVAFCNFFKNSIRLIGFLVFILITTNFCEQYVFKFSIHVSLCLYSSFSQERSKSFDSNVCKDTQQVVQGIKGTRMSND